MDVDFSEEAFKLRDPWQLSLLPPSALQEPAILEVPHLDLNYLPGNDAYASFEAAQQDLKVPDSEVFQYGPLEGVPPLDESLATVDDLNCEIPLEEVTEELNHIWDLVFDEPSPVKIVKSYSWENFLEPGKEESPSAYLSEAKTTAFDLALYMHERDSDLPDEISVMKNDVFLRSLFALGLGRSSALFRFDTKSRHFKQIDDEHNVSGLSKNSAQSLIESTMKWGQLVRHLRDFVDRTYASPKAYPARVALANSIGTIIDALELRLTARSHEIISLLQFQSMFERPSRMLVEVHDLAIAVRSARSNEELASLVFRRCQHCDQEPDWLRAMMLQILARVSQPWLDLVEQWVGFKDEIGTPINLQEGIFITTETGTPPKETEGGDVPQELQYKFRPDRLPAYIAPEDGQLMFDIGRDIRILRAHHPNAPLAQTQVATSNEIALQFHLDWQNVDRVTQKAKAFQASLAKAIRRYQTQRVGIQDDERCRPKELQPSLLEESFDPFRFQGDGMFETSLEHESQQENKLFNIITTNLSSDTSNIDSALVDFSPPIALMPVLSFNPLLKAQQQMLNAVMIRLFFRSHHLRMHLNLQRHFHLFGDGVFVSRLSAALFDPDQSSTERQRGVMRSGSGMGLRLGSRGTWPPASSELRLALMGILSDCYHASFTKHAEAGGMNSDSDLPGLLSFAIRQLSEDDAERIMNADSLHALDFLRVQYSPPSPLNAVLTPASLDRYDTIFKFLLRLTRLLFVVSHLPRAISSPVARLFQWQVDNFVTTCCRYFFETGVSETWTVFMQYLDSIQRRLQEEDDADELGTRVQEGIEDMRKQHDLCLERITFALLLRNRQQKVMKVLEDILTTVLDFSKLCHNAESVADLDNMRVSELHRSFSDNVRLFIEVCRGLVGKKGYGKSGGDARGGFGTRDASGEENTIERLVVALDYNGYYERHG